MKFNKARVLAIGAAALMAATTAMPAVPVLADVTYGTGNVAINAGKANDDGKTNEKLTYQGYQIFKANIADDRDNDADGSFTGFTGKTETNITWASDDVKTAVEGVIKETASSYGDGSGYTGTTAQDAAEWLTHNLIGDDNSDDYRRVAAGEGIRVDNSTLAHRIVKALRDAKIEASDVASASKTSLGEGYWVFDTKDSDGKQDKTGTAPIFAIIGGSDVTITEKTSIPTVTKKVANDPDGSELKEHSAIDSQMGQDVRFELTATLPDNYATYDNYKLKFTDTLPEGMSADINTVKVEAVNKLDPGPENKFEMQRVTDASDYNGYTVTNGDAANPNNLVIDFGNLKGARDVNGGYGFISAFDKIVVTYNAKFDPAKKDQVKYGEKNQNTVQLTYSNNPYTDGTGTSTPKTVSDYVYKLVLTKLDRTTEVALKGAGFAVQVKNADDKASNGKYVQADGSLGDTKYIFTTGDDGKLTVPGLDVGTYTVSEETVPKGYDKVDDFDFTIGATYKGEDLATLTNTLESSDSVIAGPTDKNTNDNVLTATEDTSDDVDASKGEVYITVGDAKRISLPLTGQAGIATGVAVGGFLVLISAVAVAKNKKKEKAEA